MDISLSKVINYRTKIWKRNIWRVVEEFSAISTLIAAIVDPMQNNFNDGDGRVWGGGGVIIEFYDLVNSIRIEYVAIEVRQMRNRFEFSLFMQAPYYFQ